MWVQLFSACFSSCVGSVCAFSTCVRGERKVGGGCDEKIEEIERSHTPIRTAAKLALLNVRSRSTGGAKTSDALLKITESWWSNFWPVPF